MAADYFTVGIDIGSAASKCVVLKNGSEIIGSSVISSGAGTSGPGRAFQEAIEASKAGRSEIRSICATGYGRNTFKEADMVISELSAHAFGAYAFMPKVRTVIDIGGQDAKVIRVDENGLLGNFVMNDKCAAGTGRFLEVMARVLELNVSELEGEDEKALCAAGISSTCTVFAESEVISQLAKGTSIPDIVRGIHESAAVRTASLVRRLGIAEPVVMTGGVAKNAGMVRALERELKVKITVSPCAQLNGAFGAALKAAGK